MPGPGAIIPSDDQVQGTAMSGAIVPYNQDGGAGAMATPEAVRPIAIVPPTGSRGYLRGPIRGARGRARDGVLNPDLEGLPAADLVAYLRRHHSSKYAFAEVSLVLLDRERRLREANEVADGLRAEVGMVRDEVDEWRRKAAEAEAVADGLRGELSSGIRRTAADAEARLRAEMEEWRRRAKEAEARLVEVSKHGSRGREVLLKAVGEIHGNVPGPSSAVRRVQSTPAPAADVDERILMHREIEVIDLTSDDEDADAPRVEQGHRAELVSRKRKKH